MCVRVFVCVFVGGGGGWEPETFIAPSNRTHQCFRSPEALAHYSEGDELLMLSADNGVRRQTEGGHVCVETVAFVRRGQQQFLRLRDLYPMVLQEERRLNLRYSHMVCMCIFFFVEHRVSFIQSV